jgi:thiosulfate/3-mercaptopyruvate sulfurtransferase
MQRFGLDYDSKTLVLYGDFNNWFAVFAFWAFKYYGYKDVRLLNGGRKKWLKEDRKITKEIPHYPSGTFNLGESFAPDSKIRIFLPDIKDSGKQKKISNKTGRCKES